MEGRKTSVFSITVLALLVTLLFFLPLTSHANNPIGGDFTLTDHHNQPYSLQQQRGKVTVMFFGFTHCPAVCPDSLVKMAEVVKKLEERADELSIVFISVDPERDTTEKLAQYVPFFSPKLLGLTGSKTQIDAVTKAYRASYTLQKKTAADKHYNVDHSADIYVLNRAGEVDTIVPYGMPASHILRVVEGALAQPSEVTANITPAAAPTNKSTADMPIRPNSAEPAFKLALHDLAGKRHLLEHYKGKTLLINFWATWCPPCRAELPALNRTWAALRDEGVAMLAVNVGEKSRAVSAFLQDYPIDFPVLLDEKGISMQRWQIKGMPTTVILNPQGELVHHIAGERAWDSPEILTQIRAVKTQTGDSVIKSVLNND